MWARVWRSEIALDCMPTVQERSRTVMICIGGAFEAASAAGKEIDIPDSFIDKEKATREEEAVTSCLKSCRNREELLVKDALQH